MEWKYVMLMVAWLRGDLGENTESDYAQACTRPRNPTQHFEREVLESGGGVSKQQACLLIL